MAAAESAEDRIGNGFRLGHAARANHAAGQVAGTGIDDADTTLAEDFKVGLCSRMLPHVDIHGRGHEHGRLGGEIHGAEKIIGDAVREFSQNIGRSGRYHERVAPLRLGYVLNAVLFG